MRGRERSTGSTNHVRSVERLTHAMKIGCAGATDNEIICEDWCANEIHAGQKWGVVLGQASDDGLTEPGTKSRDRHQLMRGREGGRRTHLFSYNKVDNKAEKVCGLISRCSRNLYKLHLKVNNSRREMTSVASPARPTYTFSLISKIFLKSLATVCC
jgi:hypothetical protein